MGIRKGKGEEKGCQPHLGAAGQIEQVISRETIPRNPWPPALLYLAHFCSKPCFLTCLNALGDYTALHMCRDPSVKEILNSGEKWGKHRSRDHLEDHRLSEKGNV